MRHSKYLFVLFYFIVEIFREQHPAAGPLLADGGRDGVFRALLQIGELPRTEAGPEAAGLVQFSRREPGADRPRVSVAGEWFGCGRLTS